ncbi:putative S-adenosylmethionine-dependent methyltransferase [Taphrina deformans PYCC 5710]|uniref:S-adenosylmethionine-dependent methyltransferase n=1 Tax=Taphrina deformans (strain PYCC 5710 / ATCC 11124 / CBS 356.35 / IMI 108563 / JCM 9778 / NBRC 8474) TaxID=1097556 RepID=R4X739_TAPDE|nr:putative S-adenosylmethionine-dependent methyltransferase [Taphrina deformans PYCC 5710]|eukprot:CCG80868.1 putative S-adenosylmethionine-dependent methyltransferase [Taphrina deformans PYCC 5710]
MSSTLAFSNKSFDSDSYATYRPTYGRPLYDQLYAYHKGSSGAAVDLGCGTGQISIVLAQKFKHVLGIDTSQKMLDKATRCENVEYKVGGAEKVPVSDASIDLVTVGQAAHWFDHDAWFLEMSRVLKPQGTLSYWSYNEAVFTDSDSATSILNRYFHGEDKLGPHWPQPGRRILEGAMDGVDPPSALFRDVERHYTAQRGSNQASPVAKVMPLKYAEAYIRTSSAFHNWQGANKDRKARSSGGPGDIVDEMIDEIVAVTGWNHETKVKVHWPTVAVLARKN